MVRNPGFRGRAYVKASYAKDPGMHKNKDDKFSTRKVLSHLQYIAYRSRELDQDRDTYGLFNEQQDHSSLKEFYQKVEKDPALRHANTVKIHKLIIGFHREWYDKYEVNYKELTRHIMKSLEERKGMKLEWVAAEHLKETSPHCHVAIKSTGTDDAGQTKRLKLDKEDMDFIREEIDRFTGREQVLEREKSLDRDMEKEGPVLDIFKDLSQTLEQLAKEGERQTEQAKRQADRNDRREAKEQKERDRER